MNSLGQSSIEYLSTYGWMLLAVSLASATLYSTTSPNLGCNIQIEDTASTEDINIEQVGITENGTLRVVIDSNTREAILVESLNFQGRDNSLKVVQPQTIAPGSELVYSVGKVEKTGSCQDYTATVEFDKGPLKDQKIILGVRGSLNLIESFASLLEISGDSISNIEIKKSVQPTNDTMCIGSQCTETSGSPSEPNEYVNYSGDEMTGTLKTSDIDAFCFGDKCKTTDTGESGYVNTEDAQVGGTLNVTEIMPVSEDHPVINLR